MAALPPQKILVIKIRAMGDTLLATPALRALRQGFPQAHLTVMVSLAGREILEGNPDLDALWVYAQPDKPLGYHLQVMQAIRREHFDLALALHASFRTALLARVSAAPVRIVNNHSGGNIFSTLPIKAKKESKSAIERDLDAIRALGVPMAGTQTAVRVTPAHQEQVRLFLKDQGLDSKSPLYLLIPGAGKARKCWTAAAGILFLDQITPQLPGTWLVLAGPEETALAQTISRQARCRPPVFCQSIKAAAALMALCQGVVTTDSGPKHVAVAMGTRTLTLWTDEPEAEWHPYPLDQHALLRSATGRVPDISAEAAVAATLRHFGKNTRE